MTITHARYTITSATVGIGVYTMGYSLTLLSVEPKKEEACELEKQNFFRSVFLEGHPNKHECFMEYFYAPTKPHCVQHAYINLIPSKVRKAFNVTLLVNLFEAYVCLWAIDTTHVHGLFSSQQFNNDRKL